MSKIVVFTVILFFALRVQAQNKIIFEPKTKTDYTLFALDAIEHKNDQTIALIYINKAIGMDPPNAFCYAIRGNIYLEQGQYKLAFVDFDQAIDLDPTDFFNFFGRAKSCYFLEKYDNALKDLNQALVLISFDADIYWWRSKVKESLGDYVGCEADFKTYEYLNTLQ
ncbi:hypothetical protein COT98_01395 [Candidatus Falkowbacteria bacterium CG10_big_fil_rev_8_21_14_0_10_39_9]|uniref:Uncharacterized protein n=1 Tax=Candidatus Falkowbacteria bacterium CG10_big_fil_rev_8_21_14_0_10_39_9 TaxID=1974566 RepID=A0A2M6WQF6_9BACT|nr:MAG: hypothetical protein COT98_01395 [Candidatus Falkowbacteria bacterium CG10_big_fil_rev_8_21_14_0_10_39_9]